MDEKHLLTPSGGKWIAGLIAIALGVAGFGIFWALRPASTDEATQASNPTASTATTTAPSEVPSTAAVTALGRLEPEGEMIKVAAPSSGGNAIPIFGTPRVARLLVKEQSVVKTGQPIAVLDTYDRLLAAGMESEAKVREAQTRLAQVQAGAKRGDIEAQKAEAESRQATVARLEAELKKAEWEYKQYQSLFKDGAIAEQELRNRQLAYEAKGRELQQARQQLEQAIKTLNSVAEIRPTDIQQAQAEVNVALAAMQRAKADLETAVVRSPLDGQVIKVHTREGEQVGADGIAEIGKTNQMYAIAEVYETDIQRVQRGQRATISSGAFSGELTGVVEQIGMLIRKNDVLNTDPAADTDVRVVEVKVRLDDSRPVAGLTNLQVKVKIQP